MSNWSKIRTYKKGLTLTFLLIFLVLTSILIHQYISDPEIFFSRYNIDATTIIWLFIVAEILFNVGIVMMLVGSGVTRIKWAEVRKFNFSNIKFQGKLVFIGFALNRFAALIPWVYIFYEGWDKLPIPALFLVVAEIIIVLIISVTIQISHKKDASHAA